MANEALRATRPERPPSPQQEHGFEQRRLARGVAPPNQVVARMQGELGPLERPNVLDRELQETHELDTRLRYDAGWLRAVQASCTRRNQAAWRAGWLHGVQGGCIWCNQAARRARWLHGVQLGCVWRNQAARRPPRPQGV